MKIVKKSLSGILEENRRRISPLKSVLMMAHNIRSLHNVGSLFRTADSFGIEGLILSGYTPRPPHASISKTALGAEQHVRWEHSPEALPKLEELIAEGYRICTLEQTNASRPLPDYRPESGRLCLLLGNEITGVDTELLRKSDDFVEIPQFGEKHSLNVSVAAGIALYALLTSFRQ